VIASDIVNGRVNEAAAAVAQPLPAVATAAMEVVASYSLSPAATDREFDPVISSAGDASFNAAVQASCAATADGFPVDDDDDSFFSSLLGCQRADYSDVSSASPPSPVVLPDGNSL